MSRFRDVLPGVPLVESPLFHALIDDIDLTPAERRIAIDLNERGYAVLDFPDEELDVRIARIKANLSPYFDADSASPKANANSRSIRRLQDAWRFDPDVRALACNRYVLDLLQKLYGRRAFPFQTLNFPVGTQQHLHSDSIHFSSMPERFMCGVWLAMEDIHPDAGPLTYLPGSHKWPILSNLMIGRRGFGARSEHAQMPFEAAWEALVETSGVEPEIYLAKKGQALIWAANLLHGGSPQRDPARTRWSQVTHYYFDDCVYYTPAFSDEHLGDLDLRSIIDIQSETIRHNAYLGQLIEPPAREPDTPSIKDRIKRRIKGDRLPADFDAASYYRLNPDVAAAKVDAGLHYLEHGRSEGRRYRLHSGGM